MNVDGEENAKESIALTYFMKIMSYSLMGLFQNMFYLKSVCDSNRSK